MGLIDSIRKEAKGNRTTIQTTEALHLEQILNRMFYLPKDVDGETEFVRKVMTRGYENQERVGLHASSMIVSEKDWCTRRQVLSLVYKQAQGEAIPVPLKQIFEEGNSIHEKWQRLFIRAGYSNADLLDVTQLNKQYRISFTPDIICTIPEFYNGQMVGEIKSMNTMQFKQGKKHPSGSKQLQFYMHLTGIHKGFVLLDDKNTQEFRVEVYDYDPLAIAEYIERAEAVKYSYLRLVNDGKMIVRPEEATSKDCKLCATCNMRDACYNIGAGRQKIIG